MTKRKIKIILFLLILSAGLVYWMKIRRHEKDIKIDLENNQTKEENIVVEKKDRINLVEVVEDSTYGSLMKSAGVDYAVAMDIYDSAQGVYDLVKIRLGRFVELGYDKETDELKDLYYKIDSEEQLHVWKNYLPDATSTKVFEWKAEKELIPYDIEVVSSSGVVESSMYQAALDNDIDERAIIELANAFQWTIDFALDPRVGDTFSFVWEKRFLNGEYQMPGRILAGKYVNAGQEYFVYYFEENQESQGYFDENGNSVQKMFLRAPVSFKYISSGFTTGARYISAFNISTGHRAIDYATPAGTPIRSVGDGTVVLSGWAGSYGYKVTVKHNSTYSTNYAHQSKIAVKKGQRIRQGDIVGYVGSTGLSTGPHLHYEMVKNGIKINPYNEVLPPGKPILPENKNRFEEEIKKLKEMLK